MATNAETATWTRWVIGLLLAAAMASSGMALAQALGAKDEAVKAEKSAVKHHEDELEAHKARDERKDEKQDAKIEKVADAVQEQRVLTAEIKADIKGQNAKLDRILRKVEGRTR